MSTVKRKVVKKIAKKPAKGTFLAIAPLAGLCKGEKMNLADIRKKVYSY